MTDLDQLLRDAVTDERWAVPVRTDSLDRLRVAHRRRQRRTTAFAVVGVVGVLGFGAIGVSSLTGSTSQDTVDQDTVGQYADGSPAPGISPAFAPQHGRDWLLTPEQADRFYAVHTRPSPAPGQSVVASPAPLTARSAELLAEVESAGLPSTATLRREDSVGGQPGATAVHVTLRGGVPLEVLRSQVQEPYAYYSGNGEGSVSRTHQLMDVPGTTSAAALYTGAPYSFGSAGSDTNMVTIVSRSGVQTTWVAPATVPLESLRTWAFAAARAAGS